MAQSPLLDLPLELRLWIYRELILTCLVEDITAEILPFLLTCRQVHQEMEDEYISKARAFRYHTHVCVLSAKVVRFGHRYELQLPQNLEVTAITAPQDPVRIQQNEVSSSEPWNSTSACLRCVFQLPHPPFQMHHGFDPNYGNLPLREVNTLMSYADTSMLDYDVSPERVIFQCHAHGDSDLGNIEDIDLEPVHRCLIEGNNENEEFFFQRSPPKCCRSWRAKIVDGGKVTWSFGFDYAEGLPEFPGAVYD
jgi:hypothetical protein